MTTLTGTSLLRHKWMLVTAGLPVLVVLWWGFRPEKLWINEKVNEPAPFETSSDPQPVLTGRFESKTQQLTGRATIYKRSDGREYLRLNDFTIANAADAHVGLVRGDDTIDLGQLKNNQSDQSYDLPPATDRYEAVIIYSDRPHSTPARANLEPF